MPEPMTTPTQHNTPTKSANLLSRHRYSPIAKELITPNFAQLYSNQSTPTVWNHSSPAKSPVKSALKSSLRSPKLFTPDTSASKSFQSNIPRPRTKLNGSSRGNDPVFEGRYETGPRGRGKSTVTKAEVSVSGSESDVDPSQDFNSDIKMHHGLESRGIALESRGIARWYQLGLKNQRSTHQLPPRISRYES